MENIISTGARQSQKDKRTVKAETLVTGALDEFVKGGVEYLPEDILHQHNVGICTAISLIQNRNKANGKKYSPDFQYLLQKKYYDNIVYTDWLPWTEGSSVLHSLKVGKRFGFLPIELFKDLSGTPYITEQDRYLSYEDYIHKLKIIPEAEIERLLSLCVDKIPGYAYVDVSSPYTIARAIKDSEKQGGVMCMFSIGNEWWTPSWKEKDVSPLRPPKVHISGHAVVKSLFDFNIYRLFTIPNTWGTTWARKGCADIIWDKYKPIEVWRILGEVIVKKFDTDLKFGMSGELVVNLQNFLKLKGFFNYESTGYFGIITWTAVKAYQKARGITPVSGFWGPISRAQANKELLS